MAWRMGAAWSAGSTRHAKMGGPTGEEELREDGDDAVQNDLGEQRQVAQETLEETRLEGDVEEQCDVQPGAVVVHREEGLAHVLEDVAENAQSHGGRDVRGNVVLLAVELDHGQDLVEVVFEVLRGVEVPVLFQRGEHERQDARNAQERLQVRFGCDCVGRVGACFDGGFSQRGAGERLVEHGIEVIHALLKRRHQTSQNHARA